MADPSLDFWFDFASTYSYLAAARVRAIAAEAKVGVRFRPFLLGPIFKAQGWETSPFNLYEAKGRHMWRDLERLAEDLDVPFRRPDLFPQNSLLAARVSAFGLTQGWGEDFCVAAFRAEFAEGGRIDDPAALAGILSDLCVDAAAALNAAQSEANKLALRAQTEEAQALGLFGAPSFTTADGELFWGNDRLEQALRWAARIAG
ncbi:MAG: 2-hydroxychromene-2-carboxylate isomerase [Hyphomicrobiales bacterium]